jgi:hypothetical protein
MVTVSRPVSSNSRSATQREALPQDSTSPPSLFQMRMRTSAPFEGSITISWSHPMPDCRSAMAWTCAGDSVTGSRRPSRITNSFPSPFILRNVMVASAVMRRLIWDQPVETPVRAASISLSSVLSTLP